MEEFFLIKTIHRDHNPRNGNHQYFEHNFPKNVTILEGDKHILLTNFYKLDVLYVTQHTFSKLPLNFENYTCIIVKMNGSEIKHKTEQLIYKKNQLINKASASRY